MSKENKLYIYILILFFCSSSIFYVVMQRFIAKPNLLAKEGVIDLQSVDIEQENLPLDGEWSFYWNKFVRTKELADNEEHKKYIHVPKSWGNYAEEGLSENGYGTYRLRVKSLPPLKTFAISVVDQSTAYSLYINGKLVAKNGKVGRDKKSSIPKWEPEIGYFETDENGEAEISIYISNFHYYRGGLWNSLEIGTLKNIYDAKVKKIYLEVFLFSTVLVVGMIFLGVYSLNPKDTVLIYFAIFCFLASGRVFLMGERIVNRALPIIGWNTSITLEYMFGYLLLPLFGFVMNGVFKKEKIKLTDTLFKVFIVVVVLLRVVLPIKIYTQLFPYYEFLLIGSLVYFGHILAKAIYTKHTGVYLTLVAYLVIFLGVVKDSFLRGHFSVLPISTLIFIVLMSVVVIENFANLIKYSAQLEDEARLDKLTGLLRRGYFVEHLRNLIEFRDEKKPFFLVFIDLDKFKAVNDTHGHEIGDVVLQKVSKLIKSNFRTSDMICRYGGDEFLLFVDEIEEKVLRRKLTSLNKYFVDLFILKDKQIDIGLSIGVSQYPQNGKTIEELIKASDESMYKVKKDGGNTVHFGK